MADNWNLSTTNEAGSSGFPENFKVFHRHRDNTVTYISCLFGGLMIFYWSSFTVSIGL